PRSRRRPSTAAAARAGRLKKDIRMAKTPLQFRHNGREAAIFVDGDMSLLSALRDEAGDYSPKCGCGQGGCGACTVLIDGEPVLSCVTLAEPAAGKSIETADGLKTG